MKDPKPIPPWEREELKPYMTLGEPARKYEEQKYEKELQEWRNRNMKDEPVKVRVMLWLEEDEAIKLRTLAAAAGCRGVSEYISDFVLAPRSVSMVETPTYVEDHEDGTD